METSNLKSKVLSGFFWVGAGHIVQKIATIASGIILARLLSPKDFGLVAIATTIIAFVGILGNLGIKDALIYQKNKVQEAANSTFFLNIFLGITYTIATFVLAPFLANFFENPEAKLVIQITSFQFILTYLGITSMVMLQKEIKFRRKALSAITASLISIAVTVILAFLDFKVWSLVIGNLVNVTLSSALFFFSSPWRPTLKIDKKVIKEVFSYSKHLIKSDIYITMIEQGDKFILGKIRDSVALGYYTLAYNFANLPANSISALVQEVSLPAFSKIRDNRTLLAKAYHKNIQFIAILSIPIATGIILLAEPIVQLVYGEKWLPMVPTLQALAVFGAVRALTWVAHDIIKIVGKPNIFARLVLFQLILSAALIVPLTQQYGHTGTAWAVTLPTIIQSVIAFYLANKYLKSELIETMKHIGITLIPNSAMIILVLGATQLFSISNIFILLGIITVAASLYIGIAALVDRSLIQEAKELVSKIRKK